MNEDKNSVDAEKIKVCWSKIKSAEGTGFFVEHFYKYMFEHYPEVHSFFPTDLTEQKTKLLNTLNNIINGMEYIDELKDELLQLGQQHRELGIDPDMFKHFIMSIVETADMSSDSTLTNKELATWKNAFQQVSDIMLEAY